MLLVTAYPQVVYEAVYMDMHWKLQNNREKRSFSSTKVFLSKSAKFKIKKTGEKQTGMSYLLYEVLINTHTHTN